MPDDNLMPIATDTQCAIEQFNRIENNQCRHCGEPLRVTSRVGEKTKSFAVTPHGFSGPILFSYEPNTSCGPTSNYGPDVIHVGINLELRGGRIAAGIGGSLTAQESDVFLGNLFLLAKEAGFEIPWFDKLIECHYERTSTDEQPPWIRAAAEEIAEEAKKSLARAGIISVDESNSLHWPQDQIAAIIARHWKGGE